MKKIFAMLILSFVVLFSGQATWSVEGYNKDFESKDLKPVIFNYTGQSITLNGMKTVTANQHEITFTGASVIRGGLTFYGVEAIPTWSDSIVWVRIDTRIDLEVTE